MSEEQISLPLLPLSSEHLVSNLAVRFGAIACVVALISAFSTPSEAKPKKPPRGTVVSVTDEKPDLVVRIESRIRAKEFVGEFADSMLEQVMFLAWPGDIAIEYRVNASGREWYLFLLEMKRYGKHTTTSPRTKYNEPCRTTYRQYFAIDSTRKQIEPYTYQVTEQICGETVTKRDGKWFEPLRILLPGRFQMGNRSDLPALPKPAPVASVAPPPAIPQPTEAELAPLKRRIGTKLCRDRESMTFIGYTEAVSPDLDRIQIRVVAQTFGPPKHYPVRDYRPEIIWDAPINWRLCD
ncbi:MAG: hypothetical protein IPG63_03685 [Xanthomonadales bacterium]|nr:hypothetical protein [Xanthomonadales bacterium]